MSSTFDGSFTVAQQDGAKTTFLPLQQDGEYYATNTTRRYLEQASYFNPLLYQRTFFANLLTYSDDLTNAAWTAVALTIGTGATDPEGNPTLCKLQETTANSAHNITHALTVAAGTLTAGAMVEAAERTALRMRINNATDGDLALAVFDLSAGVVASGTGTLKKLLNGFFWVTVTGTATIANSAVFLELGSNLTTWSYAGTAGSGLYAWHITAMAAAAAGPAIMTTAATRGITCPAVDFDDPISFLVQETAPEDGLLLHGMAHWARTYARIPKETNVPGSLIVSKPDIPRTGLQVACYLPNGSTEWIVGQAYVGPGYLLTLAGVFAFQRNINVPSWELYRTVAVTADTGPSAPAAVAGGTYTLSFNGATTASINYNDVAGTVQTRLNALANVTAMGGLVVAGSYTGGFVVTFNTISAATVDISALTGCTAMAVSPLYRGYSQQFGFNGPCTAGSYKITLLGQQTAAIAYNANIGTISAAINLLGNVTSAGGVTVTGTGFVLTGGTITFTVYFATPLISGATAGLAPAGSIIYASMPYGYPLLPLGAGSVQNLYLYGAGARILTVPSHGFYSNDTLMLGGTTAILSQTPLFAFFDITNFTIIDTNTIQVTVTGQDYFQLTQTITHVGAKRITGYQAAPINTRCQVITDYYLPGITPGITKAGDIVLATVQSDPTQFLGGMVTGLTLNYEVGDLKVWQGPILSSTKRVVNAADLGVTTINLP